MRKVNGYPLIKCGNLLTSLKTGPFGSALNTEHWTTNGTAVLTIGSLGEQSIIEDELLYISDSYAEKLNSYRVNEGDIVFSRVADIGRAQLIDKKQDGWVISSNLMKMTINKDLIRPAFLYIAIKDSPVVAGQLKSHSNGNGRLLVNSSIVKNIKIPTPELAVQDQLIGIISCWDNAIEKTEALIAAKEKQFEWLCQTYFKPGNSTNSGWEKHKIASFVTVRNEKEVPSEEVPLYSLTIENGVTAKTDRYNREFLVIDKGGKKYKAVHPKDIVFNPANLRWGAIARSEVEHKVVLSPIYEVLKVDENKIDSDFLTHALTCSRQIAIFATMVEGTLVERMAVKIDTFLSCHIYVPSSKEKQKEIAHVLNLSKQEISLLKNTLEQYRSQKRGLMQKLLTGEWQVSSSQHLSEETYQELSREGVA